MVRSNSAILLALIRKARSSELIRNGGVWQWSKSRIWDYGKDSIAQGLVRSVGRGWSMNESVIVPFLRASITYVAVLMISYL